MKGKFRKTFILNGESVALNGVPDEIKILPLGLVKTQKGDFLVDDVSVNMILEAFKNRKIDLVIDYEHQTVTGMEAPAGGWIKELIKGEDAIVAKVEWTERARKYLEQKEYKYLSPVVMVRKSDNRAAFVHSVALTNTPAIDGMFPLVAKMEEMEDEEDEEEKEKSMDLKELAKLLGLDENASEEDVKAAISLLREKTEEKKDGIKKEEGAASPVVLSLLGLNENAKTEDVVVAVMALKNSKSDEEINRLKDELAEKSANDLVEVALKEGKITAAQKDWAKQYALTDKVGFKSFLDKASPVVQMGKTEMKEEKKTSEVEVEEKILKACGVSKEDVEKFYGGKGGER